MTPCHICGEPTTYLRSVRRVVVTPSGPGNVFDAVATCTAGHLTTTVPRHIAVRTSTWPHVAANTATGTGTWVGPIDA